MGLPSLSLLLSAGWEGEAPGHPRARESPLPIGPPVPATPRPSHGRDVPIVTSLVLSCPEQGLFGSLLPVPIALGASVRGGCGGWGGARHSHADPRPLSASPSAFGGGSPRVMQSLCHPTMHPTHHPLLAYQTATDGVGLSSVSLPHNDWEREPSLPVAVLYCAHPH